MRWRVSAAFGVFFVSAAASSHWWALGDYGKMGAALVVGVVLFLGLLYSGRSDREPRP